MRIVTRMRNSIIERSLGLSHAVVLVNAWEEFETLYKKQIEDSKALLGLNKSDFDGACLLCSEETAEKCHRRVTGAKSLTTHLVSSGQSLNSDSVRT